MTIKYPVLMIAITPPNAGDVRGFGYFPLGDYSTVNLTEFLREAFPKGTPPEDPDLVGWSLNDLEWDGTFPRSDTSAIVEEMEWFLYGFGRGIVRVRPSVEDSPRSPQRVNEGVFQSLGWTLKVRAAFTDTQFMLGASAWGVTLQEKGAKARKRDARGRFVGRRESEEQKPEWLQFPYAFIPYPSWPGSAS